MAYLPAPPIPPITTRFEDDMPLPIFPKHVVHDVNVVSTFYIGHPLNVPMLARTNPLKLEYNYSFPAGMMRLHHPKAVCLIFTSGKAVVVGVRYEIQAIVAAWKYARILRESGFPNVSVTNFTVHNLSSTVHHCDALDIFKFRTDNPKVNCQMTPDNFPGASVRDTNGSSVTMTMFASGRINLTGSRTSKGIMDFYLHAKPHFDKYKVEDPEEIEKLKAFAISQRKKRKII